MADEREIDTSPQGEGDEGGDPDKGDGTQPLVDQTGRVLGTRARETRDKLLAATKSLLAEQGLRDLRVIDIARRVGTSPATFYQYFKDVESAVLCLAEQASAEMPAVAELFEGDWHGEAGLARSRQVVEAFVHHWDEHHAVLRVRNHASDEGDVRFSTVRGAAMGPIMAGLRGLVERAQAQGMVSRLEDPRAAAAAMGAVLERLAAYHTILEGMGTSRESLIETSARILHRTVTGE